jgi:hypothetical protein
MLDIAILSILAVNVALGAEFINLGFDLGPTSPPTTAADISVFLPGWALVYDGHPVSTIAINTSGNLGNAGSAILNGRFNPLNAPFEGKYSLTLVNGFAEGSIQTWRLEQSGTVPVTAKSIFVKSFFEPLSLGVNNTEIPLMLWDSGNDFAVYAADVSDFSDQSIQLSFRTRATSIHALQDSYGLDSITFSSVVVPEPRAWVLLALGLLLLSIRLRNGSAESAE